MTSTATRLQQGWGSTRERKTIVDRGREAGEDLRQSLGEPETCSTVEPTLTSVNPSSPSSWCWWSLIVARTRNPYTKILNRNSDSESIDGLNNNLRKADIPGMTYLTALRRRLASLVETLDSIFEFLAHLVHSSSLALDGIGVEKLEGGASLPRELYGALYTVLDGSVAVVARFDLLRR